MISGCSKIWQLSDSLAVATEWHTSRQRGKVLRIGLIVLSVSGLPFMSSFTTSRLVSRFLPPSLERQRERVKGASLLRDYGDQKITLPFLSSPPEQKKAASEEEWKFFLTPEDAWASMYEDCQRATRSIEFEQYIFENDPLGRRFMELFIQKAAEGVEIFLLCDKFGSATLAGSPQLQLLRNHGGRFHFYNAITFWNLFTPWRWFPRTHTKTLLIDSEIAYTGGVCMAERMQGWRDTHIRVTGPVVHNVRQAFDMLRERGYFNRKIFLQLAKMQQGGGAEGFYYLQNVPRRWLHEVYQELVQAMTEAKEYIYISTAFFAPNRRVRRLIHEARRRGVEVALLVPKHSDVPMADWLCLTYLPKLAKAGVKIYHYQPTVLHNKVVMIDDRWATIGSTNMDVISFFHNREANLMITCREAIVELKAHFLEDLKVSREFRQEDYQEFPFWKRAGGQFARMLKWCLRDRGR
jgi:cardiolipin synthase